MKLMLLSTVLSGAALFGCQEPSTIGGTPVPAGLHCEEDEVIAFVQEGTPPYSLGCVHPDDL
jgi:hypothetical protein